MGAPARRSRAGASRRAPRGTEPAALGNSGCARRVGAGGCARECPQPADGPVGLAGSDDLSAAPGGGARQRDRRGGLSRGARRAPAPRQRQAAGPAGDRGKGADTAPRSERSLSAECERPRLGPRRARYGRAASVSRRPRLAPASVGQRAWRPVSGSTPGKPVVCSNAPARAKPQRDVAATTTSGRQTRRRVGQSVVRVPSPRAWQVAWDGRRRAVVIPDEGPRSARSGRSAHVDTRTATLCRARFTLSRAGGTRGSGSAPNR